MTIQEDARRVLLHYGLQHAQIDPLGNGLINRTFLVSTENGERFVLQRLNPLFDPKITCDMEKLTRQLEQRGEPTSRPVPASQEPRRLWVDFDGCHWRLCTYVPGVCHERLQTSAQAEAAGKLLGRFHRKVDGLRITLHGERLGVHDTRRHLAKLRQALDSHKSHRHYEDIARIGERVLAAADVLPELPDLPDRLVHGDPKISNLLFDEVTGDGICMVDLDTLAYMPVPLEAGDAIRSWCNPRGEDESQSSFNIDFFAAAMRGYASEAKMLLNPEEWQSFVPAASIIMVELAARFTTDALQESYFGWDSQRFPDRSTHNLVRAQGQLSLHEAFAAVEKQAQELLRAAFKQAEPDRLQ